MFKLWRFCFILQTLLLLMLTFNKRKHVVWGTVKSRDTENPSNIIIKFPQTSIHDQLLAAGIWSVGLWSTTLNYVLSSAWAFWFWIMKLKLSSIRSIKTSYNRTKDHPWLTAASSTPTVKAGCISDQWSSIQLLQYLGLLYIIAELVFWGLFWRWTDFGKRYFLWNWRANNSAKVILTVSYADNLSW